MSPSDASAKDEEDVLRVGELGEMKTRNFLPAIAGDVWTRDVLLRVYDTVGRRDPATGALAPYILKGVDADGDGTFEDSEHGIFWKGPCPDPCVDPVSWRRTFRAYYDFNGVEYHDGTQVTAGDVLFNYVVHSLNPWLAPGVDALMEDPAGFPWERRLNLTFGGCDPSPAEWEGASTIPGDNALRCSLVFGLRADDHGFVERGLAGLLLFPRHLYEGTGGGRHGDWGLAIYPESDPRFGEGIPVGETAYVSFNYPAAEAWMPADRDVIGTGPFRFRTWVPGSHARVDTNGRYFVGVDPDNPLVVLDPDVAAYLHQPFIDGIEFRTFQGEAPGVIALERGEIDYLHTPLSPSSVSDLSLNPDVRIWRQTGLGWVELVYNTRRLPFGYATYPPRDRTDDIGAPFRWAMAHTIPRTLIVDQILQGRATMAWSVVSPANEFWHNSNLPKYDLDLEQAEALLDREGWIDTDGDGWRELPGRGDDPIKVMAPPPGSDPARELIVDTIVSWMRMIGLNATREEFRRELGCIRDFDIVTNQWWVLPGDPTDLLVNLFHSSSAACGPNYSGFADREYDAVVEAAMSEMNITRRRDLVKTAQQILAGWRPTDPLYHPDVREGTREDRFVGWVSRDATVWNEVSLRDIRPPTPAVASMNVIASAPAAVLLGDQGEVHIRVRDQDGNPVAARAEASVLVGEGSWVGGTCGPVNCTVARDTDSRGDTSFTFVAPPVMPAREQAWITISVAAAGFSPTVRTLIIDMFAPVPGLAVTLEFPSGDLTVAGGTVSMRVSVRDPQGVWVPDAQVLVEVSEPQVLRAEPASGPASSMGTVFLIADPAVQGEREVQVTVTASKAGYPTGTAGGVVTVVPVPASTTCEGGLVVDDPAQCPRPFVVDSMVAVYVATVGVAGILGALAVVAVVRRRAR